MPSMATFKTANELKRKYIKTVKDVDNDADVKEASNNVTKVVVVESVDKVDVDESSSSDSGDDESSGQEPSSVRFEPVGSFGQEKPNLSYGCLIALAIQNSPEKKLTLGQVSILLNLYLDVTLGHNKGAY
jgi:hypothetical protein